MSALKPLERASINQLQDMTGSSYRYIKKKLMEQNLQPLKVKGRGRAIVYKTPDALKAIYRITTKETEKGDLDLDTERAKHIRQQRKKVKVERLRLQRSLIEVKPIKMAMKNMVFGFKEKMLTIPTDVAGLMLACKTKLEVQQTLKEKIDTALNELVTDDNFIDSVASDE